MTGPNANACILDNQWLRTLLETGAVGFIALLAMFRAFIVRVGAESKNLDGAVSWLLAGTAASAAAYATGMLTFDAFSFVQVTLLLFIVLGLGAATLAASRPLHVRATA